MSRINVETYRRRLSALQKRLQGDVSYLSDEALKSGEETSGNLSRVPIHMADLGTDSFEQQVAFSLLENEEQILKEIATALDRIKQGTFGRCEACRKEIPGERLESCLTHAFASVVPASTSLPRGVGLDSPIGEHFLERALGGEKLPRDSKANRRLDSPR
jgi:RNA polymerase-binding transcription factor DksA